MGQFRQAESMFRGVNYNKFSTPALKQAMEKKKLAVQAKIEERQKRVTKLQADNTITGEMLADMIIQYMKDRERGHERHVYSNSIKTTGGATSANDAEVVVPAGVIANLIKEKELIESEEAEVKRLNLVMRNLKDTEPYVTEDHRLIDRPVVHSLTDDEILYLGF